MEWAEISITIDHNGVEAVANMFHELGAGGVVIEDPQLVEDYRRQGGWEYEDLPSLGPENGVRIRGYLPVDEELSQRLVQIQAQVVEIAATFPGVEGRMEFRHLEEENWAGTWKKYYRPVEIGRSLVVVPEWEEYMPHPGQLVITLDPGLAFGTGTHPSTALCLEALEEYLVGGELVFDVGTGSGILAIGAAKLGARQVVAVDVDPIAVKSAQANVDLNHLAARVEVKEGNLTSGLCGRADVVVANLTADIIMALLGQLKSRLTDNGVTILGGIINLRLAEVRDALQANGLTVVASKNREDWVTLVVKGE